MYKAGDLVRVKRFTDHGSKDPRAIYVQENITNVIGEVTQILTFYYPGYLRIKVVTDLYRQVEDQDWFYWDFDPDDTNIEPIYSV